MGVEALYTNVGPSEWVVVGMEGPGELVVGCVVGKGLVEVNGHVGQICRSVDTKLEMPLESLPME